MVLLVGKVSLCVVSVLGFFLFRGMFALRVVRVMYLMCIVSSWRNIILSIVMYALLGRFWHNSPGVFYLILERRLFL